MGVIREEMLSGRITKYDLLPLSFLKKSPYTGSKGTLRYRIEQEVIPLGPDDLAPDAAASAGIPVGDRLVKPVQERIVLRVFSWNGPKAYDLTPPEEMKVKDFDFSDEGLDEIIRYLNGLREG